MVNNHDNPVHCKNPKSTLNILDLNDDCLLHIGKFLPNYVLDEKFRHVCQRFLDIYCILRTDFLKIFDLNSMFHQESFQNHLESFGHCIETVCICKDVDDYELKKLNMLIEKASQVKIVHWHMGKIWEVPIEDQYFGNISQWQHLHTLELIQVKLDSNVENMSQLFAMFGHNLKNVTFYDADLRNEVLGEILKHGEHFEKLDIRGNFELTLEAYEDLSQKCTKLKALKINGHLKGDEYEWLEGLPQLQHFEVYDCNIGHAAYLLDSLIKYKAKKLQVLFLFCNFYMECNLFEKIGLLSSLKVLKTSDLNEYDREISVLHLQKLKNLEELSLKDFVVENLNLVKIIQACPKLKNLFIMCISDEQFISETVKLIKIQCRKVPFTLWISRDFNYEETKEYLDTPEVKSVSNIFSVKYTYGYHVNYSWSKCSHNYADDFYDGNEYSFGQEDDTDDCDEEYNYSGERNDDDGDEFFDCND